MDRKTRSQEKVKERLPGVACIAGLDVEDAASMINLQHRIVPTPAASAEKG